MKKLEMIFLKNNWIKILMLIVIILFFSKYEVYGSEKKDILFISSYNPNFVTFNDQVLGIEDGMNNNVQLQIEYMDFRIFSDDENENNFYNLLKYKINNYKNFDAIILGDDKALRFGMKYRDELFSNIPIVFLGVSNMNDLNKAIDEYGMYGVGEIYDIEEILQLALKINKECKNIIFLDGSKVDNIEEDIFKNIDENMVNKYAKEYPDKNFSILYSEDIDEENLKSKLQSFTKDDIVICVYPYIFKNKIKITYKDLIALVSENVSDKVPFYGTLSYGIGNGFLGGKVVNHYTQGKEAGIIVNKLLNGETSKNISVVSNDINQYMFDYNKLKAIGIKESSLPEGSIIVNKPISFFKKYKDVIFPISLTIIGLIGIIVLLILYSLHQKKYEKKILEAKIIAEDTSKSKNHFISNISHELRTPVAIIISANQLLKLKYKGNNFDKNDDILDKLSIIDKNCYRLIRLVNNIIDVAKIDANFMKLNLENLNAIEFLEDLVMSVIPYAENKNIDIIFDTQEEEVIMALDKEKMERVVLNLLSNAIKFSNDGGDIFFNVYIENNELVFYVADNGIGINEEDLEKIFEKFIQVDETMTRKNEGSGIGLSLVKSFVEFHNGKICVESKPRQGSKFTVKLPIQTIEQHNINIDKNLDKDRSNDTISTKVEFSDIYF